MSLSVHDPETIGVFETELLIDALIDRPVIADAARAVEVSLLALHRKMRNDDLFRELIEEAINAGSSILEAEALRRAMGEVKKTVLHNGKPVMRVNQLTGQSEEVKEVVLSDRILLKMLSALRPEKYGDKAEVTHKGGTGVLVIPEAESGAAFEKMLARVKQEAEAENEAFDEHGLDAATGQSNPLLAE